MVDGVIIDMAKTYKTSLAGVPVEMQLLSVGPAPQEDILAMEALLENNSTAVSDHPLPVVQPNEPYEQLSTVTQPDSVPSAEDIIKALTEDTNRQEPKPFWHSKVIWINAISAIYAIGAFFGFNFSIPPDWYPYLMTIVASANIFFRQRGYSAPLQPITQNIRLLQNRVRQNRT